jgi:hypothetical protein
MTDHFDLADGRNRPDDNADEVPSGSLDEQYEADDADGFDDDEAEDQDELEDDKGNGSGDAGV